MGVSGVPQLEKLVVSEGLHWYGNSGVHQPLVLKDGGTDECSCEGTMPAISSGFIQVLEAEP